MQDTPRPAFRERSPGSPGPDAGFGWAPLVFWGTLLAYAALRETGIRLPLHIVVPALLALLVVLAVGAKRSPGSRLAAGYLAAWPHAWRGVWVVLAGTCLFWAIALPFLLFLLSFVVPLAASGFELVVLMLKVAGLLLALAALCVWIAFRGHRAALAVADAGATAVCAGAKGASAGTQAVRRRLAWRPRLPVRRPNGAGGVRVAPLLGQPWDGLVLVAGWGAFGLLACIPMRRATEAGSAVFLAAAAVCLAMTLVYAGVGRIYLRTRERRSVRPVFQPFLMGAVLTLGMAALGIGISLAYGPF